MKTWNTLYSVFDWNVLREYGNVILNSGNMVYRDESDRPYMYVIMFGFLLWRLFRIMINNLYLHKKEFKPDVKSACIGLENCFTFDTSFRCQNQNLSNKYSNTFTFWPKIWFSSLNSTLLLSKTTLPLSRGTFQWNPLYARKCEIGLNHYGEGTARILKTFIPNKWRHNTKKI